MWNRSAGVLLHPSCLPSHFGIGDLGPEASAYVSWLAAAGISWWQVLPLHPPGPGFSPYSATSTFAGNPLLISPEALVENGLLDEDDFASAPPFVDHSVDFDQVVPFKTELLRRACARFVNAPPPILARELEQFRVTHRHWLEDYARYAALKATQAGAPWYEWPKQLQQRDSSAVERFVADHPEEILFVELSQLLFHRQWQALRSFANELGVRILGDVPIFVAYDSAEVWAHPELFLLDEQRRPTVVAGVPPDYFSATGQLWGNPLYDWSHSADTGYSWWIARLRHELGLADAVRLDHFRGFVAHWEVPAADSDASNGRWVPGPGAELFDTVAQQLGGLPFLAEDLGHITPDVHDLRHRLELPGMAVLQFAFSPEPRSTFLPYAHTRDLAVYTGTHDNNTTVGWFFEDAGDGERDLLLRYAAADERDIAWTLNRLAMASVANMAIIPHQDLAGLGADCRMNTPSVANGNWRFRITPWMLQESITTRLAELVWVYGRQLAPAIDQNGASMISTTLTPSTGVSGDM